MTTYKQIFGKPVKYLSTDPDNSEAEGQIWYNSTSGTFKSVVVGEAWSSSSPVSTARDFLGGAGTQTANVIFGGRPSPGNRTNITEEYNGSGWSSGGNLGASKYANVGTGSQTAALSTGGLPPGGTATNSTEEYDGSTWTAGGAYPVSVFNLSTSGIQTAALGFGGNVPQITTSAEYNGSAWTAGNPGNTARSNFAQFGTQTASIACGGDPAPGGQLGIDATESYDGTSWTTVNPMLNNRDIHSASGIQTSGIAFGGSITFPSTYTNTTEVYDGTSWASSPATLATAVRAMQNGGGFADNTTAIKAAGNVNPNTTVTTTEEYNKSISVFTPAAWASGGATLNVTGGAGGSGNTASGLAFGGLDTVNSTIEYNGSTWTAVNNLNTGRGQFCFSAGTQTATIGAGGRNGGPTARTTAGEEYDGSTWTTVNSMNTARRDGSTMGLSQTAAVSAGGNTPTSSFATNTEEYDGTSFSTEATLTTGRDALSGAGSQTAGYAIGGLASTGVSATVESYDGSAWSSSPNYIVTFRGGAIGTGGIQTNSIACGGNSISPGVSAISTVGRNDGTVWSTSTSMTNARYNTTTSMNSPTLAGMVSRGDVGVTATEEFTAETSANNFKTLTTS